MRIVLYTACLVSLLPSSSRAQCVSQIDSCSCNTDNGGKIDLRPLELTSGEPAFKDVGDSQGADQFSYNPCSGFTEELCVGVAACQKQGGLPPAMYYSIGDPATASFIKDPARGLELQYSTTEGRQAFVQLHCDKDAETAVLTADGEIPPQSGNYYMTLKSKWCCTQGGSSDPGIHVTITISAGSVLLIVFFVVISSYFLAGVVVQRIVRKQHGREMLPNSSFWAQLPGLIKDGFFFVIRRGRSSGAGYNDI